MTPVGSWSTGDKILVLLAVFFIVLGVTLLFAG